MRGTTSFFLILSLLAQLAVSPISLANGATSQRVSVKPIQENYALLIRSDVLEDLGFSFAEKEAVRKEVAEICDPVGIRIEGETISLDPFQYHPKDEPGVVKAVQEKVVDKLPSAKKERFREIKLQINGERCFLEKDVIQELGLTESEQESVKKAFQEADREVTEVAMEYFPRFTNEAVIHMQKVEKDHRGRVLKLIEPAKQEKWTKLKGKPFKARPSDLSRGDLAIGG